MRNILPATRRIGLALMVMQLAACGDDSPGFESTPQTCTDRHDNDDDGLVDCADPQCRDQPSCAAIIDTPVIEGDGRVDDAGVADATPEPGDGGANSAPDADGRVGTADAEAVDASAADMSQLDSPGDDAPRCAKTCDEAPSTCHEPVGRCGNDGVCHYRPLTGSGCDDGDSCTTDDVCEEGVCRGNPRPCDTPPDAKCVDGALLSHAPAGRCVEGECDYDERPLTCTRGCDDAGESCAGDPCEGVRCTTPPSGCFQAVGFCAQGACSYRFDDGASCDDGDSCTEGDQCASGVCAGREKRCLTPPENRCIDASTLMTHTERGTCGADGQCDYDPQPLDCPHGCDPATHRCKGDPCAGVRCDAPPSDCFEPAGECRQGRCVYGPADGKSCDDRNPCTIADRCSDGICSGQPKVCAKPTPPRCLSPKELRTFGSPGQCRGGECDYPPTDSACTFGCVEGACLGDPCAGVRCDSPPKTQCYVTQGICTSGRCTYPPTDGARCDDRDPCTVGDTCAKGDCRGTPMRCDSPRPNTCRDERTLVLYGGEGECVEGECVFPSMTCPHGCDKERGACRPAPPDPCAGVRCVRPPKSKCQDARTLLVYPNSGICHGGRCEYAEPTSVICKNGCRNDRCLLVITPLPRPLPLPLPRPFPTR